MALAIQTLHIASVTTDQSHARPCKQRFPALQEVGKDQLDALGPPGQEQWKPTSDPEVLGYARPEDEP